MTSSCQLGLSDYKKMCSGGGGGGAQEKETQEHLIFKLTR